MKTLLLPLLACGATVVAQGIPTQTTTPPKTPLPPQVGVDKTAASPVDKPRPEDGTPGTERRPMRPVAKLPAAATSALANRFAGPDCVVVDGPVDDAIWAAGGNYKVHCTVDGFRFLAAPADPAVDAAEIRFELVHASAGGHAIALPKVAPEWRHQRIQWQRGKLVERLDVRHDGVEQSFVVDGVEQRGELALELRVATNLLGEDLGNGVRFTGAADIGYSEAIAIDANGNRSMAPTELRGDRLSIRVPAAFVEQAAFPLVVDPWIASRTVHSTSLAVGHTDVAWNESSHSWALTFERRFAANDTDVYVQNLGQDLTPVGALAGIDISSQVWQKPAIANMRIDARLLVVAQVSDDDPAPYWISGRLLRNDGSLLSNQFVIEKAGVTGHASGDKLNPVVGGDPFELGPTYFTVVWERAFSPTDHDIHMKQVTMLGSLRSTAPTPLANSTANQTNPAISKSDGPGDAQHQRFAVVFQQTFGPADEDIHGCLLTWDGQIHQVNGQNTFPIDTSWHNDVAPKVSSPTLGNGSRLFLCAYERTTAANGHVVASPFTSLGAVHGATDLSQLHPNLPSAWPQRRPSVETDGCRFTVAFDFPYGGSGSDLDIGSMLIARTPQGLAVHDASPIAWSNGPERDVAVGSRYSGSGEFSREFAIANAQTGSGAFEVEVHRYWGHASGGINQRPTACGGLGITVQGIPAIGETLSFGIGSNDPFTGVVAGVPANTPIPVCPSCTLGASGIAVLANPYVLTIPLNTAFVGGTVAFQGFTFTGGPCLGQIATSDTIDVSVR